MEVLNADRSQCKALPTEICLHILNQFAIPDTASAGSSDSPQLFEPVGSSWRECSGHKRRMAVLLHVCSLFRTFALPHIFGKIRLLGYHLEPIQRESSVKRFLSAIIERDEDALRVATIVESCAFDSWEQGLEIYFPVFPAFINLKQIKLNGMSCLSNAHLTQLIMEMPRLTSLFLGVSMDDDLEEDREFYPPIDDTLPCSPLSSLRIEAFDGFHTLAALTQAPFVRYSYETIQVLEIAIDTTLPPESTFFDSLCHALPLFTSLKALSFLDRCLDVVLKTEIPPRLPPLSMPQLRTLCCPAEWADPLLSCAPIQHLQMSMFWGFNVDLASVIRALRPVKDTLQCLSVPLELTSVDWSVLEQFSDLQTLEIITPTPSHPQPFPRKKRLARLQRKFFESSFFQGQRSFPMRLFPNLRHFEMMFQGEVLTDRADLRHAAIGDIMKAWPKVEVVQVSRYSEWNRIRWSGDLAQDWVRLVLNPSLTSGLAEEEEGPEPSDAETEPELEVISFVDLL